jgi:hypothetical protein
MSTAYRTAPPIPQRLVGRETIGGRVIPWIQVRLADGGVDFRARHNRKVVDSWTKGLCQIDGEPLDRGRFVLLGGPDQVAELLFDEPPMHPECARYTALACEMVAGRREHYARGPSVSETHRGGTCVDPTCDCGGWVVNAAHRSGDPGRPAHPWYALWAKACTIVAREDGELHGAALLRSDVRAISVVVPGETQPFRRLSKADAAALIRDPIAERPDVKYA